METGSAHSGGTVRIRCGYLNRLIVEKGKVKKRRWVVFQGNPHTRLYQLKLYKNEQERVLKTSFTITKDNFLGTERGEIRKSKTGDSLYWAILLQDSTIVFQELVRDHEDIRGMLESWNETFRRQFENESWLIHPRRGLTTTELKMTLHLTAYCLGIGNLNPPKCFVKWSKDEILSCRVEQEFFYIQLKRAGSEEIEVKAENNQSARLIKVAVDRLISAGLPQPIRARSPESNHGLGDRISSSEIEERYTPSPTMQSSNNNSKAFRF